MLFRKRKRSPRIHRATGPRTISFLSPHATPDLFNTDESTHSGPLSLYLSLSRCHLQFCFSLTLSMATAAASPHPILPISTSAATTPSPSPSPFAPLVSRLSSSLRRSLALARPWPELVDPSAFSPRPDSLPSAINRLRRNLAYFRLNYSLLLLFTLSLSLFSHPVSLILLLSLLSAWSFLYFSRTADSPPLILLGRQFSSREILFILSGFSFFLLFFTSLASLIIQSLLVGLAIVCVHGALRVPEDLFLDEQEAAAGSVAGGGGAASGLLSFLSAAAASATANPASHV